MMALTGNMTCVKIVKNKNGQNEFFIENEKHQAVMITFSDGSNGSKIFAEHIAIPNSATWLDKGLELLESPLKVDYNSYLDGTFLSSMTSTGLIETELPKSGSIKISIGNKKTIIVTAIDLFSSSLDFALSYAELASGKKVSGLKKYLQYLFFYNAIRNPDLINSCTTILANLPKEPTAQQIENSLIQIKDEYMKYLEGNLKDILSKSLYSLLDFKMSDSFENSLKLTLAQVKNLAIIGKFGGNIIGGLSSLIADIKQGERVIGFQFFMNANGKDYPQIVKDIPLNHILYNKLNFLTKYDIPTVSKLYYDDGNYEIFNPENSIETKHFIHMIVEAYNRIHYKKLSFDKYGSLSADIFSSLSDKLYVEGSTVKFKETILLKDAIAVMYYLFEHSYGLEFRKGKIYNHGTREMYSSVLYKIFNKNHYEKIKIKYSRFYLTKTRLMYKIYGATLFRYSYELNNTLTKAKAINLIYDYMKYHHLRQ